MEILFFKKIDSTHKYLIRELKTNKLKFPICISSEMQTDGIGSRKNSWISKKGNLFLSLCVNLKQLPKDLPLQSSSIYFAYIFKEVLSQQGSKIWVKWPNDLYIEDKKIGGIISSKISDFIICSIGLNTKIAPDGFGKLDIELENNEIVNKFVNDLEKFILWKQVFSKYKIEFRKSMKFGFHKGDEIISLKNAKLDFDGSISIHGKKIYNLR